MAEHPNVELVRSAYAAISAGNGEPFMAMLADGVKWHYPGKSPLAGDYEGREAVRDHFHAIDAATTMVEMQLLTVLADDRFAIAIEHNVMAKGDNRYDRHDLVVFRIKDGQVAEAWVYPENQYELDAVLS